MSAQSVGPKVLVVDDDSDFVFDLKTWLTQEGFRIHAVEVGQAAIQRYWMYRPYAAVVLDLHMPKVDGFQVLKQIKKADANTKVAVLTADATARDEANALGADAFVVKPVGRKAVCELVHGLTNTAARAA
jgi:CheY-like chemotaxis protein